MKLSNKMKTKLKTRLASATAIIAVLVLVFACSRNIFVGSDVTSSIIQQNLHAQGKNLIEVFKDSTGINISVSGYNESGINKIEVYQETDKIEEYNYSDGATDKNEKFKITIPFGETSQITVMVNGDVASQKFVNNMRYIYSVEDLVKFRDIVNGGNKFSDKHVELMNDIDMSSVCSSSAGSWTPISTFSGTFNGQYHTIKNIYINQQSNNQGLFGIVTNGHIMNLTIKGGQINTNYGATIGGIVGNLNNSVVTRCVNDGVNVYGDSCVGGIVGASTNSSICYCLNRGTITGSNSGGGIIGGLFYNSVVDSCVNLGNVPNRSSGSNNGVYLGGGIVAYTHTNNSSQSEVITNCYNMGSVYGKGTAGGITASHSGYGTHTVKNCYSMGTISGNKKGGIVGEYSTWDGAPTQNFSNNYWLSGCGAGFGVCKGGSNTNTGAASVSAATIKDSANTLGVYNWVSDTYGLNGEYPILRWQIPQLKFDINNEYISVGETLKLNLNTEQMGTANPGAITYASENTNIATVDNTGTIRGISEGTTAIYATEASYGIKAMMKINVTKAGSIAIPQVGTMQPSKSYGTTIVLKENGTVWRLR